VDFKTAFREWNPPTERGDSVAQNNLGFLYDSGTGVPEDDTKAVNWYKESQRDKAFVKLSIT
jgi:hypothetical protein